LAREQRRLTRVVECCWLQQIDSCLHANLKSAFSSAKISYR
jgi:hypothetical protein